MVVIARKVDTRPVIGAAVVFLIIGSIIFGIYYVAIAKPAADALAASKDSAISQINSSLATIGTDQATTAASNYVSQVQAAGSTTDVSSILVNVTTTVQTEQKRKELLDLVNTAADGAYYSAAGSADKVQMQALTDLSQPLKAGVNAKATKAELEAYESTINNDANSTWRTLHTGILDNLGENVAMRQKNSAESGGYLTKSDALANIAGWTWGTLRKIKFENMGTVEVPVLDTFQRTPTIVPGTTVDIYAYDTTAQTMENIWTNATVRSVIYSQSDIGTIAWTLADGTTSQSYSVNMWETIKAAAAGDAEAAAVGWSAYGTDVMSRALQAQIGSYSVSAIYMVQVPEDRGTLIAQYEFHQSSTKDVILIARV